MDNKKEQERAELHKTIWAIANDLRGSVDGWDFKQYVLGFLFYRFISENLTKYINDNQRKSGIEDFNYLDLQDEVAEIAKDSIVEEKGFFIYPSWLFKNVVKNCDNDEDLNITLGNIFKGIEASANGTESEGNLKGLFDDIDLNSRKLGDTVEARNKTIRKVIKAINELKLGNFYDNQIDAFGDAYEFLMTMYAANGGKSGGEFFTPQEVSELLAKLSLIDFNSTEKVAKKQVNKVYDPACGSGSLLLKFAKILGKENVKQGFYGQEKNLTTYNLCRINMFLHDINFEKFNIAYGDTLVNPYHWDDKPFDAIVSNPPYSTKWEGDSNPLLINDERFSPAGVLAPKAKADFAFIMHILSWLSSDGTASIIEFPGILYRGGAEQKIRQYLVDNNYIDSIIAMPSNLFFGNTITTCVLVLRKNKINNTILFIDASKEFSKVDTKNKLLPANIEKIVDVVAHRKVIEGFSKEISYDEIVNNNYNLSTSTYLGTADIEDDGDIDLLNEKIDEIVVKNEQLRRQINMLIGRVSSDENN